MKKAFTWVEEEQEGGTGLIQVHSSSLELPCPACSLDPGHVIELYGCAEEQLFT